MSVDKLASLKAASVIQDLVAVDCEDFGICHPSDAFCCSVDHLRLSVRTAAHSVLGQVSVPLQPLQPDTRY